MEASQQGRVHCLSEVDKALLRRLLIAVRFQRTDEFATLLVQLINKIDDLLSAQLAEIIENPDFKALEARWLSAYSLASMPTNSRYIKIKLLDFSWDDVSDDLNNSLELRRTQLFRKTYSQELDTAGGEPFGLIVMDHLLTGNIDLFSNYDDLFTTQLLGELGQTALCPIILGVHESFIAEDPERTFHDHRRLMRIFDSDDLSAWQQLRSHSSSRFICATLPRVKIRGPWRGICAGFQFNQPESDNADLWGNCAYLVAANVMREYNRISWFGFLRAMDADGDADSALVTNVNVYEQPIVPYIDIFAEHDAVWSQAGFMPLTTVYLTNQVGFFSNQSVWQSTDREERSAGMLQTTLMACRFGHYLKAQIRDKNGSYNSLDDCRRQIDRWFQQYVSDVDYADDSIMARYPLRKVHVEFMVHPVDSTRYYCQIALHPQYQYEQMEAQVILKTELSAFELGELK
ncbi:Uncharacterised protein [BD1-7 clade bacterium]|uniref:Type VI secretion system contractile sheath large subunit n=1 Tax=BD1-7 clade bacterium TaxID=2029982 RepID=A0A5S9QA61_9GAMM|nr:Uncharacterised protein [BD1-7 clade bacterium]CAA0115038.1 Uncharacterised protein [BD1-7 clade bacterium]